MSNLHKFFMFMEEDPTNISKLEQVPGGARIPPACAILNV